MTDADGVTYTQYCDSDTNGDGAIYSQNFMSGDFMECDHLCSTSAGCGAWVWSPGNPSGGMCYLKSLPQTAASGHSGLIAGIATQESKQLIGAQCQDNTAVTFTNTYIEYCGSDTSGSGGDLRADTYDSGDFSQCAQACDGLTGCGAWVFAATPGTNIGGMCYLKGVPQSPTTSHGNFIAGILLSGSTTTSTSSFAAATSTSSSAAATSTSGSGNGGNGIRQSSPSCQDNTLVTDANDIDYTLHCGYDTTNGGFASANFQSGGYLACENFCDHTPGCGAWVWTGGDSDGGDCYAKQLAAPLAASGNPDLVAGIGNQETVIGCTGCSGPACSTGTTVHDSSTPGSKTYTLYCGSDTSGGINIDGGQATDSGDYSSCQNDCDTYFDCTAWVFAATAQGGGACYLNSGSVTAIAGHGNLIAGISQ